MRTTDTMAWNRRSSRFEPVLPRSSEKEKQGYSTGSKSILQMPNRALVKVARVVLIAVGVMLLVLVLVRRSSNTASNSDTPSTSNNPVSYLKSRWSSSGIGSTSRRPAEWAIKTAEAILPDARTSTAQWEQERLLDLAKVIECRANNDCTHQQKHVVISGVGRWKWSLDETFERPAFFPNGEAGWPFNSTS